MKAAEIREMSDEELREQVKTARRELFGLRFQHATGELENTAGLKSAKRDLACSVSRSGPDAITARCENHGSAYAQPREIDLTAADGTKIAGLESAAYILPGMTRTYTIKRDAGPIAAGPAKLVANFDDGTSQSFDVTVGN